jgi:hypothetical protein
LCEETKRSSRMSHNGTSWSTCSTKCESFRSNATT